MARDTIEVRLTRRQETEILKAARARGRINLIMDGDKAKLSAKEKGSDVTVIDFDNRYYEKLITALARKGIVPSNELIGRIENILAEEKAYEDGEFFMAIGRIDGATEEAVRDLRKQIEALLQAGISPKLKNDYRAVLRKLDSKDYKPDYVEKWMTRLKSDQFEAYESELRSARDAFGDAALLHRMYGRLFLRGKDVEPGKSLRWVRLTKPE